MSTTTVTVQLTMVRLTLGKKNYDFSAELQCNGTALTSRQSGTSAIIKANTENTVLTYGTEQPIILYMHNVKAPATEVSLQWHLINKKTNGEMKKYEKNEDCKLNGTSPASVTQVFGDIGNVTYLAHAWTAEYLAQKRRDDEAAWRKREIQDKSTELEQRLMAERYPITQEEKQAREMLAIKERDLRAKKLASLPASSVKPAVTTNVAGTAKPGATTTTPTTATTVGSSPRPYGATASAASPLTAAAVASPGSASPNLTPRVGGAAYSNLPSPSVASTSPAHSSFRPAAASAAGGTASGASTSLPRNNNNNNDNYNFFNDNAKVRLPSPSGGSTSLNVSPSRYNTRIGGGGGRSVDGRRDRLQMTPLELLQDDEIVFRADVEIEERGCLGVLKSARDAADRRFAFERLRTPPPAKKPPLSRLQIAQRQETTTRERILHEERVELLQVRSAQGGDRRRREIVERDYAAQQMHGGRVDFNTSMSPPNPYDRRTQQANYYCYSPHQQQEVQQQQQQRPLSPRLRQPEYYLGNRAMTQHVMLREEEEAAEASAAEILYARQQQQQQQEKGDPIVIGGMMLSPTGNPRGPRVGATEEETVLRRMQLERRAQINSLQRPISPRREMQRDLRELRAAQQREQLGAEETGAYFAHGQQQQHHHHHPHQQSATSSSSSLDEPIWNRLLNRCKYAPALSEREIVDLEWITLRELATDVGFTDRDDVLDIYETWRAKNKQRQPHQKPPASSSAAALPSVSYSPYGSPGGGAASSPRLKPRFTGATAYHSSPRQRAEYIAKTVLPAPPVLCTAPHVRRSTSASASPRRNTNNNSSSSSNIIISPPASHYNGLRGIGGGGISGIVEYAPPERNGAPASSSALMASQSRGASPVRAGAGLVFSAPSSQQRGQYVRPSNAEEMLRDRVSVSPPRPAATVAYQHQFSSLSPAHSAGRATRRF